MCKRKSVRLKEVACLSAHVLEIQQKGLGQSLKPFFAL